MSQFWPPVPRQQVAGVASVPVVGAGAVSAAIPISFAGFTTPPRIVLTPGHARLNYEVGSITTTGATIVAANWTSGAAGASSLPWVALAV